MFCSNCGKELKENARFCAVCGTPVAVQPAPQEVVKQVASEPIQQVNVYDAPVPQQVNAYGTPVPQQVNAYGTPAPQQANAYAAPAPQQSNAYGAPAPQQANAYGTPAPQQSNAYGTPVPQQANVYADPENQQTNAYAPVESQQEGFTLRSTYEKKPKKKKTAVWIAAAAAAVAVVLIVLNFNAILSLFQRNSSPEQMLKNVEKDAVASLAESVSDAYGELLDVMQSKTSAGQSEVHLVLSDDLLATLQDALYMQGVDVDVTWLNDIMLIGDTKIDGDLVEMKLGIGLGDVQLLTLHYYMDMLSGDVYIGVPELSDQYLLVSQSLFYGSGMAVQGGSMPAVYMEMENICEFLPSADVVEQLINKYVELMLDSIEKVEKSEETLTSGGLEQTATELKVVLHEADVARMALAVLKEAKNDSLIRDIVKDAEDCMSELGMASGGDIYKEFQNAVQEMIDDLEDQEFDDDGESVDLYVYVDGSNQIIGRRIESDAMGITDIYYQIVTEGNEFAFETDIMGLEIVGSGKRSGNLCSGAFEIAFEGDVYLEVEFEDFDEKKLEDNILSGTTRLKMGSAMEDLLADEFGYSMFLSSFGLELVFDNTESQTNMEINVVVDDSLMFGIYLNAVMNQGGKVSIPSGAIEFTGDEEAAMEWVSSFDFDTILDNLGKTDIPYEYLEIVEYYISELESLFS